MMQRGDARPSTRRHWLTRTMAPLATENLAWCVIEETAIFLDIDRDRYFRLPEERNREFLQDHGHGPAKLPAQPASLPRLSRLEAPTRQSPAMYDGAFRLGDVARAIWLQRRVERRLVNTSLAATLQHVRRLRDQRSGPGGSLPKGAARDVRAFEHAKLIRTAADRCLPRSLALALALARHDCATQVVLGVKLAPFGAHCWTQLNDQVLNDEVEEVARYSPILVV